MTTTTALPTIESIEFDFEEYALTQGIPETVDPLPYRKAGSVFATGEEAEPTYTSAKHDPRLRTVVCRHWLRDLCMKGSACEFLHQYDLSKMPLCRHGDRCKVKDCPFRHISDADRLECVFYCQGFCIHGPFCRYKHARRDRADLPAVADFTLGLSQMQAGKDGALVQARRPAPKPNEFYKVSLCKHFMQGDCPFGEGCHFAHGEAELKKFPRTAKDESMTADTIDGGTNELTDNMFGNDYDDDDDDNNEDVVVEEDGTNTPTTTKAETLSSALVYYPGGSAGGGKPTPLLEPEYAAYFIVRAATYHDVAISTKRGEWYLQRQHAIQLHDLYSIQNKPIMIFFTVSESDHIQGAALVTSSATPIPYLTMKSTSPNTTTNEELFTHKINIAWYRKFQRKKNSDENFLVVFLYSIILLSVPFLSLSLSNRYNGASNTNCYGSCTRFNSPYQRNTTLSRNITTDR
jgi:cleavage and polyadenylation specificity factor subunit 4